ncbi:MAG: phosphatidate cytidylyltransferase [Sandaracinus sp.]|nr:phosphatidate cytidylyltransferase [Sandaracinus sp.]MCB9618022.1 phosphatidate cytidylyltransferase [Sandaracinus sp.]MCB9622243.1 phosphatidate cytidylyltransferase [Sandaracinus sp.]
MTEPTPETQAAPEPEKKGLGSTALRLLSALPLIPSVLWLMFGAPKWAFEIFGLVWIGICGNELMNMTIPESRLARVWGTLATVGLAAATLHAPNAPALAGGLLVLALGGLFVALAAPDPIADASRRLGWVLGGPIYVGATLGGLAAMHQDTHGGAWVLLSMFLAFLSDTGAYFAGRAFGRTKLYPKLSPKKTVEGSIGGLVAGVLGALALQQTLLAGVLPMLDAVLVALVGTALGQAGDLLESLIKRSCGVKDSGNIMPGHGGLLDRSDALMFTSATVWAYLTWILPLHG